ncbi:MAG: carbohydrate binding family 9 domain-containing protein, partial [Gemmatimonadaceae bacterium]
MCCRVLALTAVVCALPFRVESQAARTSNVSAVAVRASQPPNIDGRADDAVWQRAPKFSEFRQFQPRADTTPSLKTEFQVAYDEKHLFAFVRMFDPHPDSIMHALSRRDVRGPSDQIKLIIDSYDDKRTGYEFAVNPDGVKRDYSISNDGNEDDSWNGIWDVETTVDSLGWTAEFRIPLSQLRYAPSPSHTFGFGVWRDIERYAERVSWPTYSPTRNGLVSQMGRLTGIEGITTARRLELTPYTV